jgi:hypothetical protein
METIDSRRYAVRLFLEGCVVVASILIAFLLDAWWTDREFHHELELELSSVKIELKKNRDLVNVEIASLGRIAEGARTTLEKMDAEKDSPAITLRDADAWLITLWGPTLDASFGAVDALVASGRLAYIDNPELSSGLAGIKDFVEDAVEEEFLARRIQIDQQIPMISDRIDLGPIVRIDAEYFGEGWDLKREVPSYANVQYPNDLEIRNVIMHRVSWLIAARDEMIRLSKQLDRLIALMPDTTE